MDFALSITPRGDHRAHLVVTGELDAFTALELRWQLDDALVQGCTRFTADLAGIAFIDAAGLAAFVYLNNATAQLGGSMAFVAVSPSFRQLCRIAGLTETFRLPAWCALVE